MSANADSVRFKFASNLHDWAYFEKSSISGKTECLHKIAYGLGQDISCIKLQGYFQMMQKKQTF